MLCDKHVCKMIVESCQLLCSVFYFNSTIIPPYKLTHKNHPCVKWVRYTRDNFEWLLKHLKELLNQYTLRYNKIHKCQEIFNWIINNKSKLYFRYYELTPFVQCMPKEYQCNNEVEAYKKYYINEKLKFAKWKLNNIPQFVVNFNKHLNF